MKGISIAIFGFLTLGVAIAALVWVQYNAFGGIRDKADFADDFAFMRMNQEFLKSEAYIETMLERAGQAAARDVSLAGGRCDGDFYPWRCGESNAPKKIEILDCVGEKTRDYFNEYIRDVNNISDTVLLNAGRASDVWAVEKDDGGIEFVAEGVFVEVTDGKSYLRSDDGGIITRIDEGYLLEDYEIMKRWDEEGVAREKIVAALSDESILQKDITAKNCGCGAVSCPDEEDVVDEVFPCWEDRIDSAVRKALDDAIRELENSERFYGGKVSCDLNIGCISKYRPTVENTERSYHESDICCGDECTGCTGQADAVVTPKICRGISSESLCEKPDCAYYYEDDDDIIDYRGIKYRSYASSGFKVADVCEMCCIVRFSLAYETDVMFRLSCTDERSGEALVWNADFFVTAKN